MVLCVPRLLSSVLEMDCLGKETQGFKVFKVQGFFLFVTYSIIENIIRSEM